MVAVASLLLRDCCKLRSAAQPKSTERSTKRDVTIAFILGINLRGDRGKRARALRKVGKTRAAGVLGHGLGCEVASTLGHAARGMCRASVRQERRRP